MPTIFYDHLVLREEVTSHIDKLPISDEEKAELVDLIDQTLHHHTLNLILKHLPPQHHPEFIAKLHSNPSDPEILTYLKGKIQVDIELEITTQAAKIKKDLLSDIHSGRRKK